MWSRKEFLLSFQSSGKFHWNVVEIIVLRFFCLRIVWTRKLMNWNHTQFGNFFLTWVRRITCNAFASRVWSGHFEKTVLILKEKIGSDGFVLNELRNYTLSHYSILYSICSVYGYSKPWIFFCTAYLIMSIPRQDQNNRTKKKCLSKLTTKFICATCLRIV